MIKSLLRWLKTIIAINRVRNSNTFIASSVHFLGTRKIKVGVASVISDDVWINSNYKKMDKDISTIEIGDRCFIGKRNFFSSGKRIKVGNYFLSSCNCSFLSSHHSMNNPFVPYINADCSFDDQIVIGDNVCLGANVTILGNVLIGYGSIIGANSLVLDDIPPFSIAVGSPARVIKRYSFVSKDWLPVQLYDVMEKIPDAEEYARMLDKYSDLEMPIYAASYRFGSI